MEFKTCMYSFPSYIFCIFTCSKFMKKFTHILPFTSTVSPVHMLYIDAVELCFVFAIFIYLFIFFSHRMWFISGHKNKGSCWCCFIVFSCNQLASETVILTLTTFPLKSVTIIFIDFFQSWIWFPERKC